MRYFSFLAQIFHLSLPKIWQAQPNKNYFSKKYKKQRIIPKSLQAIAVILKLWVEFWTCGHFQSFLQNLAENTFM